MLVNRMPISFYCVSHLSICRKCWIIQKFDLSIGGKMPKKFQWMWRTPSDGRLLLQGNFNFRNLQENITFEQSKHQYSMNVELNNFKRSIVRTHTNLFKVSIIRSTFSMFCAYVIILWAMSHLTIYLLANT